jgi:hypothetical protein
MQPSKVVSLAILTLALTLAASIGAQTSGDLFYTRYQISAQDPFKVKKVAFSYDGATLQLGARIGIAQSLGADGLVFSTRRTLLVAGQSNQTVCEIDATTGAVLGCSPPTSTAVFHITMDPDSARIWTSAQPGNRLIEIPVNPSIGTPIVHAISNGAVLTQIMFAPTGVFYTSSAPDGLNGELGTVDLSTWTLTPKIAQLDGLHGIAFDRHTGHLITFGSRYITQIDPDPSAPRIVARLDVNTLPSNPNIAAPIDQGTTDGRGLVFAAVNGSAPTGGHLIFLDITSSKNVARPDNSATPTLDTFVDDVAPLSGPGCSARAQVIAYGTGWPGASGVPALSNTLPLVQQTATLTMGNSSGTSALACLMVVTRSADVQTRFGGKLLVEDLILESAFILPPSGRTLTWCVPSTHCGISLFAQMVQVDAAASHGVAFSRGLQLMIGN